MRKQSGPMDSKKELSGIKTVLAAALAGVMISAAVLAVSALVFSSKDISKAAMLPCALATAALGGFCAGLAAGFILRSNGLVMGGLTGGCMFIVALALGMIMYDGELSVLAFYKLALFVISGMIGGIVGVNRRHRPPKPHKKR